MFMERGSTLVIGVIVLGVVAGSVYGKARYDAKQRATLMEKDCPNGRCPAVRKVWEAKYGGTIPQSMKEKDPFATLDNKPTNPVVPTLPATEAPAPAPVPAP